MNDVVDYCWLRYGDLMRKTIDWFRKHGLFYRSTPWRTDFLQKYSRGTGLDLGCGLATTTRELLRTGFLNKLVLLDIVEETLLRVCSLSKDLVCIKSDVLNIPFIENSFDTVYLLAVLHHIPGAECRLRVLNEVRRVLKRDGYAIITTWSPDLSYLLKSINYVELDNKSYLLIDSFGERYYYFYEMNELLDQLIEAGFEILEYGFFTQNPKKPEITRNIYVVVSKQR